MGKYPYIYSVTQKSKNKGLCKICGENKSDTRIDVANNYFRGDDSVYNVHKACLDKLKMSLEHVITILTDTNNAST